MIDHNPERFVYSRLLPAAVGLVAIIVTLALWRALDRHETDARREVVLARAESARVHIRARVEQATLALIRMASRWELRETPIRDQWLSDANLYVRHDGAYRALLWVDRSRAARWWVGRHAAQDIIMGAQDGTPAWAQDALTRCRPRQATPCLSTFSAQDITALQIVVPVIKADRPVAFIAGVLDAARILADSLQPEVLPGYGVSVVDPSTVLYRRGAPDVGDSEGLSRQTPLGLPGIDWRVRVWPAPGSVAYTTSVLPTVTLLAGLLTAVLLASLTRMLQRSALRGIECRRASAELETSEQRFRQLAEGIHQVFWMLDPKGNRILYVSPAYENLSGRTRQSLYRDAESLVDAIHPDDRERARAALRQCIDHGNEFDDEYRMLRSDGTPRCVWARGFPIKDPDGGVYRVAGIIEDVTDRKYAEECRLAEMAKQRDALVREVHHRIKNNLQGVVGLLRGHMQAHPETAPALETALTQIHSIATVHGLNSSTPQRQVRMRDLVHAIVRLAENMRPEFGPAVLEMHGDVQCEVQDPEAVPIALIINELISNALKHARPEDGKRHVEVDLECARGACCLRIRNTGSGLPPGFDFEAGSGLGTGLGLVKSLMPAVGAAVTFDYYDGEIVVKLCLTPPTVAVIGNEG